MWKLLGQNIKREKLMLYNNKYTLLVEGNTINYSLSNIFFGLGG